MTRYRVVLVTAPAREGPTLARGLVASGLAACVNLVPKVRSIYSWKGRIEDAAETLLVIKTRAAALDALIRYVRKHHSYEVPEIISLPIERGHKPYLDWLGAVTRPE